MTFQPPYRPSGRSVWLGKDLAKTDDWIVKLSPATLEEIDASVSRLRGRNAYDAPVRREEFPLVTMADELVRMRQKIATGRGFFVFRGLDRDRYCDNELGLIFRGFGAHFGHEPVLPWATNGIVYRILIFYIGALAVIMSLVPWNQIDPGMSPFVLVFDRIGIPVAADIVNLVVITAAMSSCNSGLYSTGRMLHALSEIGQAPSALGAINRRHLPAAAITVSAALMLVGVFLNFLVPDQVFIWVTSVALIGTLWTWAIIMLAHRGYPVANWLVVGFLIAVAALLSVEPGTRVALYVAPIWFGLLGVAYIRMKPRPRQNVGFAVGQSPSP